MKHVEYFIVNLFSNNIDKLYLPYIYNKSSDTWDWTSEKLTEDEFNQKYSDDKYKKILVE